MEQKRKSNVKGEICTQIAAKIITKTKKAVEDSNSIRRWRFAFASKRIYTKKQKQSGDELESDTGNLQLKKITLALHRNHVNFL